MRKKGISIVVLVIIMVIVIILASTIIMVLNKVNIIENSNKGVYISKINTYKNSLELYHYDNHLLQGEKGYNPFLLQARGSEIKNIISEMEDKHINDFAILDGELVYIGDNELEKKWLHGIIKIVDGIPPDLSNIEILFDNNGKFVREVTVTINNFPEDSIRNEYSIDGKNWNLYNGSFKLIENGILYVRATDAANNETVRNFKFNKIDRINPNINDFTFSVTENSIKIDSVDCSDNQKVLMYQFSINEKLGEKIEKSTYEFLKLNSGTNYSIAVTVYDEAGNSFTKIKDDIRTLFVYDIIYNDNNGNTNLFSQAKIEGKDIKVVLDKPIRNGYVFLNWNTKNNGQGKTYNPGDNYIKDSNVVFYAIWRKKGEPILNVVKIGDYIEYLGNGYNSWQVLYNDKNGYGIEIISSSSVKNISINGKDGYINFINILNKEAYTYLNSKFARASRCVGSDLKNNNSYDIIKDKSIIKYYKNKNFGPAEKFLIQNHHKDDVLQLKNNNMLNISKNYWLASRNVKSLTGITSFIGRYIDFIGNTTGHTLAYAYKENIRGLNISSGFRPCIKLYDNVEIISGSGTKNDPYKIDIE